MLRLMIPFIKMHGCGNDFVVLDARVESLSRLDFAKIAHRQFGVGCDQVVILEPSSKADVFMRIINADGSEVESCGNASRCVGWLVAQEQGAKNTSIRIETKAGIVEAFVRGNEVTVDMGAPRLLWNEIPLSSDADTLHLPVQVGVLRDPVGVSMGNPHAVFFVDDVDTLPLEIVGKELEHHPLFPQRANIGIAQIITRNHIKLRVWERGAGLTLACGTGACAALVAANRRGLVERTAQVRLPGGILQIEWNDNNHVLMTGEVATSYAGQLDETQYQ